MIEPSSSGREALTALDVKQRPHPRTLAKFGTVIGLQPVEPKTWTRSGHAQPRAFRSRGLQRCEVSDHGSWLPGVMNTGGQPATSNTFKVNAMVSASTPSASKRSPG